MVQVCTELIENRKRKGKIMKTYNIECAFIMPFNDPYMLSMEPAVEAVNKNMKNMRMIIKFS